MLKFLKWFIGFWVVFYIIVITGNLYHGNTDVFEVIGKSWGMNLSSTGSTIGWFVQAWWDVFASGPPSQIFFRWLGYVGAVLTQWPILAVLGFLIIFAVVSEKFLEVAAFWGFLYVVVVLLGPFSALFIAFVLALRGGTWAKKKAFGT